MTATCPCGRVFAKPFGMRVHQRTCPTFAGLSAGYRAYLAGLARGSVEAAADAYRAAERQP